MGLDFPWSQLFFWRHGRQETSLCWALGMGNCMTQEGKQGSFGGKAFPQENAALLKSKTFPGNVWIWTPQCWKPELWDSQRGILVAGQPQRPAHAQAPFNYCYQNTCHVFYKVFKMCTGFERLKKRKCKAFVFWNSHRSKETAVPKAKH